MTTDIDYNRLRWQCRRGMLELDLLLGEFLHTRYSSLDAELQRDFQRLLEQPDPLLQRWLFGSDWIGEVVQPLVGIVSLIRAGTPHHAEDD